MNTEEITNTLRGLAPQIERDYRARIEGIFGSHARGDDREDSDLDVLVEFREKATLYDLVGLADFLEEALGCKVDLVSTRGLRDEIKPYVLQDLVRV